MKILPWIIRVIFFVPNLIITPFYRTHRKPKNPKSIFRKVNRSQRNRHRLVVLEERIMESGEPYELKQLTDFPYQDIYEIGEAYENDKIGFDVDFNGEFVYDFGTRNERILNIILTYFPILIVLTDIVLAILFTKWILLLGILFMLIGTFASSPKSMMLYIIFFLGGILFLFSFFTLNWTWTVLFGTMFISQNAFLTGRVQSTFVVKERALHSEVLFCYLTKHNILRVKDIETNTMYKFN